MSNETDPWTRIAIEIAEGVRRDLQQTPKLRIRTRGSLAGEQQIPKKDLLPVVTVVVVLPSCAEVPDATSIAAWLKSRGLGAGQLDIYYAVADRHWAALAPRELCPSDEQYGTDHGLVLRNLMPEFVFVPRGASRPPWCSQETTLVEWPQD